jgi:AraC family ethanolamine operon transcriptional activator
VTLRMKSNHCTSAYAPVGQPSGKPPEAESWISTFDSLDLEDFTSAQLGWKLDCDQLSKGRFTGSVQHVRLPGVRLVLEASSRAIRSRGQTSTSSVGFALGLSSEGAGYFHGQPVDRDSVMIGRGDELDLTTPDDTLLIAIVVSQDLLSEVWQLLYQKPWSAWLDQKFVVQARHGMADHVRATHLRMLDSIARNASLLQDPRAALQLRDAILMDWLEAIPEQVDTSELKTIESRRRLVDKTCELMLSQPDRAPTMLTICREIGASSRKLDYVFRDVLGISPAKYLKAVRLNGVRRELLSPSGAAGNVHDIAARWGFWHMGAFSGDYKVQFGELPSATVRETRRLRDDTGWHYNPNSSVA